MFGKENSCLLSHAEIDEKVADLRGRMTLTEKVSMLNGVWDIVRNAARYGNRYNPIPIQTTGCSRLGIRPIAFSDGPRGIVMGRSTCFPVSMARGASFDPELETRIGRVIGVEARAGGANYFGGVCVNLLRHPAWGRAQETYGEDPFHVGTMGAALTRGVQEHNVMACVKHYALNNIENSRFSVNVECDERVLREVYLPHFRRCIEAGAASVMGAYNRVRGDHCCESEYLLTKVLRDDWGFEGFTISDFIFGVRDGEKAIRAGLDIEMPMPVCYGGKLMEALRSGRVEESTVDAAVSRVIRTQLVFENTPDPRDYPQGAVACAEHVALSREAAAKSMVLIKNERSVLPFDGDARRVVVLGSLAAKANTGDHGSSSVTAPYVVTPLDGIRALLGPQAQVDHFTEEDVDDEARRAAVEESARAADWVVIVAGCDFRDEGEYIVPQEPGGENPIVAGTRNQGMRLKALLIAWMLRRMKKNTGRGGGQPGGDRASLSLKDREIRMIRRIAPVNPRTAVVLVCGSMIMTREWDEAVPAILYGWYAGMEGGTALASLLTGAVNPSGRLPFSIPRTAEDLPYFSNTDETIRYGLYHGYTLLDRNARQAAYPFGHGLGYTTFAFRDAAAAMAPGVVDVSVLVQNTGSRDGEQVVQVYAGLPRSAVERQRKLLKGFRKVAVPAGETVGVTVSIPLRELARYDERCAGWVVDPGTWRFWIGSSSYEGDLEAIDVEIEEESSAPAAG